MRTVDRIEIRAGLDAVYRLAADVERWPEILPHYRWVRRLEPGPAPAVVEMAAWRPFGPVGYPTWWVSEMWTEPERRIIRYRHIRGITRGMDVTWTVAGEDGRAQVTIVHGWRGPRWPLVGAAAARLLIGPVFIHGIASRTLAGVKRAAEALCDES